VVAAKNEAAAWAATSHDELHQGGGRTRPAPAFRLSLLASIDVGNWETYVRFILSLTGLEEVRNGMSTTLTRCWAPHPLGLSAV
jgi:hypothetical protein